jgi:membrane associated rhomboid family serine protease
VLSVVLAMSATGAGVQGESSLARLALAQGAQGSSCGRRFPTFRAARFTFLTTLLLLLVFIVPWMLVGDEGASTLFRAGSFVNSRVLAGEWWRFITCELVHENWEHVLWNCAGLLLIGMNLEPKLGTLRTAVLFALGSLSSSAATFIFCTNGGGASGAIFALMGAHLTRPLRRGEDGSQTIRLSWLLAAWWTYSILRPGADVYAVDDAAHIAGLTAGIIFGALCSDRGVVELDEWPRGRRFVTAALASLALLVVFAPDPRWSLGWHRNAAIRAESAGDLKSAARHWAAIETMANPTHQVDAVFIENAAHFRLRRHDFVGARTLLGAIAPTLQSPKTYLELGVLMARYAPRNETSAFANWNLALQLDPCLPQVLDVMASTILSGNPTRRASAEARALAWCAVENGGMESPDLLHTLACAYHDCKQSKKAEAWMRRAIQLDPAQGASYTAELADWARAARKRHAASYQSATNS